MPASLFAVYRCARLVLDNREYNPIEYKSSAVGIPFEWKMFGGLFVLVLHQELSFEVDKN